MATADPQPAAGGSPPIACTLDGSELSRPLIEIRALGREALLSVDRHHARAILRFRRDPVDRRELERIVAAESNCCSFLDLGLSEEQDTVVLTIVAPEGGEPVMHELVDAFAAESISAAD